MSNATPKIEHQFSTRFRKIVVVSACMLFALTGGESFADDLAENFVSPPASAKPWVFWFWLGGNINKEGITADLEAMKKVGLGGAIIMEIGCPTPGSVTYMSDEWRRCMKHATDEANRLGLEIVVHNGPGWTSSGGPWITPDLSMQEVVSSETNISGPGMIRALLPQPFSRLGWYRDIAVIAIPSAGNTMRECGPEVTSNCAQFNPEKLVDGDWDSVHELPRPEKGKPHYIQFSFTKPFTARSVLIVSGLRGGFNGSVEFSQDGSTFKPLQKIATGRWGQNQVMFTAGFDAVTARHFRVVITDMAADSPRLALAEINFSAEKCLNNWGGEVGYMPSPDSSALKISSEETVSRRNVIDCTLQMEQDGSFTWNAPAGNWRIIRIGHTSTGVKNHPAPDGGEGLECDKLSETAFDAHWDGMLKKIIGDGAAIHGVGIDSYEVGPQNWTSQFSDEFKKRRGYDLLPYLPVLTGRIIESADVTERFCWDFRKTIAELFADNYYGRLGELCRQHNLTSYLEPYGGPFDEIASGLRADVSMDTFWNEEPVKGSRKSAASVAHTGGKIILGAEAFTCAREKAGWREYPYSMKTLGDDRYCSGINKFIIHRYAHQPWLNVKPGMVMGACGIHFERTVTWWDEASAWMTYLSRCQFLLQRGLWVGDIACFTGEKIPNYTKSATVPKGYQYDLIHPIVLNNMTVAGGRLTLPSGMSYRVLVLPKEAETMTIETARQIRDLVSQGAVVLGARPLRTPGLAGYPASEAELKQIANEVWGTCDGKKVFETQFGKGRVFCGKSLEEVLSAIDCKPDFEYRGEGEINYTHRAENGTDIYFVATKSKRSSFALCTFRINGREPEFFHPDTGIIERCAIWRDNGRTTVPISFDPSGSLFVVFRKKPGDHLVEVQSARCAARGGLSIIRAWYGDPNDETKRVDITDKLQAEIRNNALDVMVDVKFAGHDPARGVVKKTFVEYEQNGTRKMIGAVGKDQLLSIAATEESEISPSITITESGYSLIATNSGTYRLVAASGAERTVSIESIPAPVKIEGPWEVNFAPGWGAPERATFKTLISWSEHSDTGIKYFSGSAVYRKTVSVPGGLIAEHRKFWLDLGDVQVIARVKLNGHDLGIFWKPPFRVDITDIVKPGDNELEVKVVNLWVNRLIGDEQLPPDCKYSSGGSLSDLPDWLVNNTSRTSGRKTFTTHKFWSKDDAPLPSGLIGPVKIIVAEVRHIASTGNIGENGIAAQSNGLTSRFSIPSNSKAKVD